MGRNYFSDFPVGRNLPEFIEAVLECKIRGVNIPANYYTKAMEVWQELRARVALPSITESYPHADDNELLDLCRKERRVELAFENHRFLILVLGKSLKNVTGVRCGV